MNCELYITNIYIYIWFIGFDEYECLQILAQ